MFASGGAAAGNGVRAGAVPVRGRGVRHGARPDHLLRGLRQEHLAVVRRPHQHAAQPPLPAVLLRVQVLDAPAGVGPHVAVLAAAARLALRQPRLKTEFVQQQRGAAVRLAAVHPRAQQLEARHAAQAAHQAAPQPLGHRRYHPRRRRGQYQKIYFSYLFYKKLIIADTCTRS